MNQISKRLIDTYGTIVPSEGISAIDPEREQKILTRCLAAFSIYALTGCSEAEAASAVVDGADDNGIDAIYFSQSSDTLYISQSKWIKSGVGAPNVEGVMKFCTGVKDLINSEWGRFNALVNAKRVDIELALSTFDVKIKTILIHTGSGNIQEHASRCIEDLISIMNDSSEIMSLDEINQSNIYKLLAVGVAGRPVDLEFTLTNWGKEDHPLEAYYGTITGTEVRDWWLAHKERLFERNLRSVLGKTDVNQEILSTIENRPADFWLFNNGITLVASEVSKKVAANREFGSFRADGASIVNGAQTVSTIGRFPGSEENIKSVRIPIRVISLKNAPQEAHYEELITRSNNMQNRIEGRDFVTQDREQGRLRLEMALEGYSYNVIRSEVMSTSTGESVDLAEATVSLACGKADPSLAVLAKRNIGQFWSDTKKSPYKAIFNSQTSATTLLFCVKIMRCIDKVIHNRIKEMQRKSGLRYGVLVHGNRLISSIVFNIIYVKNYGNLVEDEIVSNISSSVINLIFYVVEENYSDNFMATLFKNTDKSKVVFELTSERALLEN